MKNNRYKIITSLAMGGMGQTYIVEDTEHPHTRKCVLKQLKPANADAHFFSTAQRLFKTEAEKLKILGNHPQIPQLLDEFEEDGEFYIVQEFIDGHTLSQEMPLGQRWSEPQVIALLEDLLLILEFIHAQGVIHRDIKPDNIIRRSQDHKLVLIDFGAVKQIRLQTTTTGLISQTVGIGTMGYMPMEQASGKPVPSSDIYALGMVAIQALTGLLPSQLRNDNRTGELVWKDQAEASEELVNILENMTRVFYTQRYKSATSVLQKLAPIHSGYTPTIEAKQPPYTPTTPYVDVTPEKEQPSPEIIEKTEYIKTKVLPQRRKEVAIDNHARKSWWQNQILFICVILLSGYLFYIVLSQSSILSFIKINSEEKPILTSETSLRDFVTNYFNLINSENYDTAWTYLSPQFQEQGGGYQEYVHWWGDKVEYVNATPTNVRFNNENEAVIYVQLQFTMKDGRTLEPKQYQYILKYNSYLKTWQIDK